MIEQISREEHIHVCYLHMGFAQRRTEGDPLHFGLSPLPCVLSKAVVWVGKIKVSPQRARELFAPYNRTCGE